MINPDLLFWRVSTLLCGLGFAALAVFVAVPDLDLWSAAIFFDGSGFPWRSDPALRALRLVYWLIFVAACIVVGLTLVVRLLSPSGWQTPIQPWLFFLGLLVTGPGLVANFIFKDHWGRARPDALVAFGGDRPFSLPFALADACAANCSFISGEGSAAAAVVFGLLAVFWPVFPTPRMKWMAVCVSALWLAGAGLLRVGSGKHFLSDTVFAFVLMGMVTAVLYRFFTLGRVRAAATPEAVVQDAARAARAAGSILVSLVWERTASMQKDPGSVPDSAGRPGLTG